MKENQPATGRARKISVGSAGGGACTRMKELWAASNGLETLIYLLLGLAWVVIHIAQNAQRKGGGPRTPPGRPRPPSVPPPALNPEEELRRFLSELSGETAPATPPPPSPTPVPPTRPRIPTMPSLPPASPRFEPSRATRRPTERPRPRPPRPAFPPRPEKAEAGAIGPTQALAELAISDIAPAPMGPPPTPGSSPFSVLYAVAPVTATGSFGKIVFPVSTGLCRHATVSLRGRAALQKAVLHQAILGSPRSVRPYHPECAGF